MQLDGRKAVHAGVTEQPAQCGLFFFALVWYPGRWPMRAA